MHAKRTKRERSKDILTGQMAFDGCVGLWWDLTRDFSNYSTVSLNHKGTSSLLRQGNQTVRERFSLGTVVFCIFRPWPSLCLFTFCYISPCLLRCFNASRFGYHMSSELSGQSDTLTLPGLRVWLHVQLNRIEHRPDSAKVRGLLLLCDNPSSLWCCMKV